MGASGGRGSLRDEIASDLRAILDTDVAALELWLDNQKALAGYRAAEPELIGQVEALAAMVRAGAADGLSGSWPAEALRDTLGPVAAGTDYSGAAIVGPDGVIWAATEAAGIGRRLSAAGLGLLAPVLAGEALVSRPFREGEMVAGAQVVERPWMVAAAPVAGEAGVVAALVLQIRPEQDFTRILEVARMGASGHTYAFDAQGLMLSDSRDGAQLKALGLAPEGRAILTVQVRDPGGDLTRGHQPALPLAARPLTRMAAAAVAGEVGVDVAGYPDYRGVPVVGAWRWLDAYGFGVATEADYAEVYAPLRPIRLATGGLAALFGVGALGLLGSGAVIQRLRRRVEAARQLGQYTLIAKIGEGGMGEVYEARHALLRRPTAVKVLKRDAMSPDAITRFEREVQLSASLTHPNSIEIYDFGRSADALFYYAMEYLPGIDLAELLALGGALPAARAVHILRQICGSLREAHGVGLIHRDIKPANVMLCPRGGIDDVVKVLDFGLAREIGDGSRLTAAQGVIGTPAYIAPERLAGAPVDHRVDLYAVGAVGFNLLTGRETYAGRTSIEIVQKVLSAPPPRPSAASDEPVPAALDQLIVACLARRPEDRPASAAAIIEALDGIDAGAWDQAAAHAWWQANAAPIAALRAGRSDP